MPREIAASATPRRIGVVPPVASSKMFSRLWPADSSSESIISNLEKASEISIGSSTILKRNSTPLSPSCLHFSAMARSTSWENITPSVAGASLSTAIWTVSGREARRMMAFRLGSIICDYSARR